MLSICTENPKAGVVRTSLMMMSRYSVFKAPGSASSTTCAAFSASSSYSFQIYGLFSIHLHKINNKPTFNFFSLAEACPNRISTQLKKRNQERPTSASYNCFAHGNPSAEYECTLASPSCSKVTAAFSVLFTNKAPINPPDLSTESTSISTSRCMNLRVAKSDASDPYGSLFSEGLRAVLGARIPVITDVSSWLLR